MAADSKVLDFGVIQEPFDRLCEATGNLLEREYPAGLRVNGADAILIPLFRVALWDSRAVRQLCDERVLGYNPRLAVAIPPLARTILDAVFTVVFLFNDLPGNSRWYWRSGWREACEQFRRRVDRYGAEPAWTAQLEGEAAFLCRTLAGLHVSPDEVPAVPPLVPKPEGWPIKYWPTPSQMVHYRGLDPSRRAFLQYLNDWLYRRLSSQGHGSAPGLSARGAFLMEFLWTTREERDERLGKYKSDNAFTVITLVLTLASEIEREFRFGPVVASPAQYVWKMLIEHDWGEAIEIYQQRYEGVL
jgi:hypothetical protein